MPSYVSPTEKGLRLAGIPASLLKPYFLA